MANTTIWRGSGSATLTIGSIQTATTSHISSYAFYCNTSDLSGNTTTGKSYTTTIKGNARVNKSKEYTITSYLIYSHKFANGSTTATSNKVDNTITVHEPLNNQSLKSISINEPWVWSNAVSKNFTITPTFDTLAPYSYEGQYISDSPETGEPKGSIQSSAVGNITTSAINTLTWKRGTGSTNLGEKTKTITIKVKSTANSAPSAVEIADRIATIEVRNAVTRLHGLSDASIFGKATTNISQTVKITPSNPYSDALTLVPMDGSEVTRNSITKSGSILTLNGNNITLNTSHSENTENAVEFKFKVRSVQGAETVYTDEITFTVSPVKDLTDQTVIEGQTITISNAGIGEITHASVTSGPIEVVGTHGAAIELKGTAVDNNTNWVVTIQNGQGTTITISGTTKALADVSASINTGDFIIVGKTILADIGDSITQIITELQSNQGKASIDKGWLKYEAFTANGPIDPGQYAIKVKGANGATRTVNINVSNITATLS